MPGAILDTSFLINFVDPTKPYHRAAVAYYRACLDQKVSMYFSAVAAGEFEMRQAISDLPLQSFLMLPYEIPHAVRAARLFRLNERYAAKAPEEGRKVIINDLKIIAQAVEEDIPVILTADEQTLARIAGRLLDDRLIDVHVLLLADGCQPHKLVNPQQGELSFGSAESEGRLPGGFFELGGEEER